MKQSIFLMKIIIKQNDNSLKAYPNPFNSFVVFEFVLEYDSHVKIDIYDINGKHVNTILKFCIKRGKIVLLGL